MKVFIGQPPLSGNPQLLQNRQYQNYSGGTRIYPVILAYAATLIHKEFGHQIQFNTEHKASDTDVFFWEVKTPTIDITLNLIRNYKKDFPDKKFVLMGDHVTFDPDYCKEADAVILGGHYDFGIYEWFLTGKKVIDTRNRQYILDKLPIIDRELTNWRDYAYKNGNFKSTPATYTMFGRDCWWRASGGCSFCSWTSLYPTYQVMSVSRAIEEVKECQRIGVREIFDDSGTFPVGKWLDDFCNYLIQTRNSTSFGCNMRAGCLTQEEYKKMKLAGFRMLLMGLESANQYTLNQINKGISVDDVVKSLEMAKKADLEVHLTTMVGYPWENYAEAKKTIDFVRALFKRGLCRTVQATSLIPYPGTKLYTQCKNKGWFSEYANKWTNWDMSKPITQTPYNQKELCRSIYKGCLTPSFLIREVTSIRSADDLKYLFRKARYLINHLKDFSG